jgi:hypothetical protein
VDRLAGAMLAAAALGVLVERVAFRPSAIAEAT